MDQICSRRTSKLLIMLLFSGVLTGAAWAQTTKPATPPPAASKAAGPTGQTAAPSKSTTPAINADVLAPVPDDKVILKIGDQKVTKAEFEALIQNLNPQTQKAIATQPQGKKMFGDNYAVSVALAQQAHLHHLDENPEFIERLALQKQQMEAQIAYQEIIHNAKPTPEEVKQYYTAHASEYDQIMVRQFVIRKKTVTQSRSYAPGSLARPGTCRG